MLVENPVTITHQELHMLGLKAKGKIKHLYLHWTAGYYGQVYDNYHINIDKDGEVYITCRELYQEKSHTFMRNTDGIGIALCCGVGARFAGNSPKGIDFGENSPTMMQIEKMAQVTAILADALDLPIKFAAVATHAEVAIVDGYGPLSDDEQKRWDLWFLPNFGNDTNLRLGGVTLREKAQWYKELFDRKIAA